MTWRDEAACLGKDTELWMMEQASPTKENKFALSMCHKICTVQEWCLKSAIKEGAVATIRGGEIFSHEGNIRDDMHILKAKREM